MGQFRMRFLLGFCATFLHSVRFIDTFVCDFGDPDDLLTSNALVSCHMDIDVFDTATVRCPSRINDTEYVWHPQPAVCDHAHLNTYVGGNGKIRSVVISDVVHSESNNPFIRFECNGSQTELHLNTPMYELVAIIEHRLIFICGPRDLVLSDTLQRHLDRLNGATQMQAHPWTPPNPLTDEITEIGNGLGVFFLYRGHTHLPLQGCGSRPSPLFLSNSDMAVNPITGIRSCVVDPMSRSPIGFLCEGRIEPEDCMRSIFNPNGEVVAAPEPYAYWCFDDHKPWVVAKYFNGLALPSFNGECRCIGSENGQVNAKIAIRSTSDYVCNITNKIFRNLVRPISGPWCSVVLHPGSTLTIRFPIEEADGEPYDEYPQLGLTSQKLPKYLFKTEFQPTDLTKLWQSKNIYHDGVYDEILYHEALAGDALELDVSQFARGEVKLTYHLDKPLTLISGLNSFFFHWTLKAINKYVFDSIHATVNVSLALTHYYLIVGCDRGPQNVFDPDMSNEHCSTKIYGNGMGQTYECAYHITWDDWYAGIHCRPNEELLPNNCDSTGYDLYSNRIMSLPGSMRPATSHPIRGFQVFDFFILEDGPVSFACICVDQRGYEKSRLIVESTHQEDYSYTVSRDEVSHTWLPYISLPWKEVGVSNEGPVSSKSLVLYNMSSDYITLHLGASFLLRCDIDSEVFDNENNCMERLMWLPRVPELYHYTVENTSDGPTLISISHEEVIAGTKGGFEVFPIVYAPRYREFGVKSDRGAIIISKHPIHKKYVPMTFVCGKAPKPSDLSFVTSDAPTSNASAQHNSHIVQSSSRYTWHVVEVAVETTDPYMQGCGVTYASDEFFKPETPPLYDGDGKSQFGCKIDLQAAKEAAFYCPAPYVLDPPNCFSQVLVDGSITNLADVSKSLRASRSNHFVILHLHSSLLRSGETLHQTPPLQCRCVTIKGIVLSTIQIENY
ncbi:hypothetical protein, conserved [Babesia ovata]|uniref:6-Cys domain-containing protein n=1 Tax=Babesia ovata TaxID=189622 RepID=A0A2H6KHJ0_9APIC|nr:uncharacterized protein BOVATA_039510 [Babesia ovata]GBE62458.1 hypothetical protein, conserved [Babesia ovata]